MSGARRIARNLAHRVFLAGDRVGVHVLPAHYYSPVASRRDLRATQTTWRRRLDPIPFPWDVDAQAEWLVATAGSFPAELPLAEIFRTSVSVGGFRYGPIEAQFLYSYIRTNRPTRIVEIGSGSSTLVMSRAVQRNAADGAQASRITACDPYTADRVAHLPHVTAEKIGGHAVDPHLLGLQAGDLLFVDSTHAVRTGSELAHLYLELLPRLAAGVVVHIHDIYLPYLFGPDLFRRLFDWQETTLVAAVLAGNPAFRVLAAMSGLFHDRPDALHAAFPEYRPRRVENGLDDGDDDGHYPSSLWLEVTGTTAGAG